MSPEDRSLLISEMVDKISTMNQKSLTEEELAWVRLAIAAEARKIKFRDAVIEKSLTGLVWSAILGFGYVLLDFLKTHGLKLT